MQKILTYINHDILNLQAKKISLLIIKYIRIKENFFLL